VKIDPEGEFGPTVARHERRSRSSTGSAGLSIRAVRHRHGGRRLPVWTRVWGYLFANPVEAPSERCDESSVRRRLLPVACPLVPAALLPRLPLPSVPPAAEAHCRSTGNSATSARACAGLSTTTSQITVTLGSQAHDEHGIASAGSSGSGPR